MEFIRKFFQDPGEKIYHSLDPELKARLQSKDPAIYQEALQEINDLSEDGYAYLIGYIADSK